MDVNPIFFPHRIANFPSITSWFFFLHKSALLLVSCVRSHVFMEPFLSFPPFEWGRLPVPVLPWLSDSTFVIHVGIWWGRFTPTAILVFLKIVLAPFGPLVFYTCNTISQSSFMRKLEFFWNGMKFINTKVITSIIFISLIYPVYSSLDLLFKFMFCYEDTVFY